MSNETCLHCEIMKILTGKRNDIALAALIDAVSDIVSIETEKQIQIQVLNDIMISIALSVTIKNSSIENQNLQESAQAVKH